MRQMSQGPGLFGVWEKHTQGVEKAKQNPFNPQEPDLSPQRNEATQRKNQFSPLCLFVSLWFIPVSVPLRMRLLECPDLNNTINFGRPSTALR